MKYNMQKKIVQHIESTYSYVSDQNIGNILGYKQQTQWTQFDLIAYNPQSVSISSPYHFPISPFHNRRRRYQIYSNCTLSQPQFCHTCHHVSINEIQLYCQ